MLHNRETLRLQSYLVRICYRVVDRIPAANEQDLVHPCLEHAVVVEDLGQGGAVGVEADGALDGVLGHDDGGHVLVGLDGVADGDEPDLGAAGHDSGCGEDTSWVRAMVTCPLSLRKRLF